MGARVVAAALAAWPIGAWAQTDPQSISVDEAASKLERRGVSDRGQVRTLGTRIGEPVRFETFADGSKKRRDSATVVFQFSERTNARAALREVDPEYQRFAERIARPYAVIPEPTVTAPRSEPADKSTGVWFGAVLAVSLLWGYAAVRAMRRGASETPAPVGEEGVLQAAPPPRRSTRGASWDDFETLVKTRPAKRLSAPASPAAPVVYSPPTTVWPVADGGIGMWWAITWREQRLLDEWDASAEKRLGRATFGDWLDARAKDPGVDIDLLKSKLTRDA